MLIQKHKVVECNRAKIIATQQKQLFTEVQKENAAF